MSSYGTSFPRKREPIDPNVFRIPAFTGITEKGHKIIFGLSPGRYIILLFLMIVFLLGNTAFAESTSRLIDKGNKSWVTGQYDEAIKSYDEAAIEAPESPYIYFNKGAALYKKGDYNAAIEAFEKAALKSKDPEMEAKSRYNLGNCAFREAERELDSDLNNALALCQKSILHYQDALKLDPDFKEAAENVEIVRLTMKNILDEIKKKEEEAKQKKQQEKQIVQDLQELIKRQEEALEKNRQISGGRMKEDKKKRSLDQLADEQKAISEDTQKLSDKIRGQSAQQDKGEENPALTHLNNAVKEQAAAEGNLRNGAASNAENNQENAVKELKEAIKPPEQNQKNQGEDQKKEKQQDQQGQEQKDQDKTEGGEPAKNQDQQQDKGQAQVQKAGDDDAQAILDEEKENQRERRMRESGGYKDVDKDW